MGSAFAPRPTLRFLALATAFALSAAANAANYDPRIAYTSYEGKGDGIYLANADGSLKVLVHKTNKTIINGLDFTAGRVAFTESGVEVWLSGRVAFRSLKLLQKKYASLAMWAATAPNVICAGVGLKLNFAAGMESYACAI